MYVATTGGERLESIVRLVDVNTEANLPSFWSSLNLLLAAGLLFVIFRGERAIGAPRSGYWGLLSATFLLLAIDEAAALHENASEFQRFTGEIVPIAEAHTWVLYGALAAVVFGLVMYPFLDGM